MPTPTDKLQTAVDAAKAFQDAARELQAAEEANEEHPRPRHVAPKTVTVQFGRHETGSLSDWMEEAEKHLQ